MKIPEKIRIGGVDYAVVEEAGLNDGTRVCYGFIDYESTEIKLNPDNQQHQKKCRTMWHEIIHGIVEHANMNLEKSDDEAIVGTIAKGVYQVLCDNCANLFDVEQMKNGG